MLTTTTRTQSKPARGVSFSCSCSSHSAEQVFRTSLKDWAASTLHQSENRFHCMPRTPVLLHEAGGGASSVERQLSSSSRSFLVSPLEPK